MDRRTFLGNVVKGVAAVLGGALGFIWLGPVASPAFKPTKRSAWVNLGNVDNFTPGQPKRADFTLSVKDGWMETQSAKAVWVVRQPQGDFTVYNSRCTHLGCLVDWKDNAWKGSAFYSPCHGGVFTIDGEVIAGPPPRPLDTLEYEVREGKLYCQYMDFQTGRTDKVPV